MVQQFEMPRRSALRLAALLLSLVDTAASRRTYCEPNSGGSWTGEQRPFRWVSADGCVFRINTIADFQLAFAGRSVIIMGDSVSRDVALSVPMRYAGCDAQDLHGMQLEATLGPNTLSDAWCAARKTFHHQNIYKNYTFRLPLGPPSSSHRNGRAIADGGGEVHSTVEYHWSRFLRDFWRTPVWHRFVVAGAFVPGRDALVFNGVFWHLALEHEKRYGMRNLTLKQLFPQWKKELDATVTALVTSPHVAALRQSVFWRTCTWREWPGAGQSYKPAFDNYHINHANRYARARFRKAGFRVIETEKYSFHASLAPTFSGKDASLVVTKDSVHFPPAVNLAMFREIVHTVHATTHHLWPGPLAAALGKQQPTSSAAATEDERDAYAAIANLIAPAPVPHGPGSSSEPAGSDEDDEASEGGGPTPAAAAAGGSQEASAADDGTDSSSVVAADEEFGSLLSNSSEWGDGSGAGDGRYPQLSPFGSWFGVQTVTCPTHAQSQQQQPAGRTERTRGSGSGNATRGAGFSHPTLPHGGGAAGSSSLGSRLVLLDEVMLYAYMATGGVLGAVTTALAMTKCSSGCCSSSGGPRLSTSSSSTSSSSDGRGNSGIVGLLFSSIAVIALYAWLFLHAIASSWVQTFLAVVAWWRSGRHYEGMPSAEPAASRSRSGDTGGISTGSNRAPATEASSGPGSRGGGTPLAGASV